MVSKKIVLKEENKLLVFLTVIHRTAIKTDTAENYDKVKIWLECSRKSHFLSNFLPSFLKRKRSKMMKRLIGTINLGSLGLSTKDTDRIKDNGFLDHSFSYNDLSLSSDSRELAREKVLFLKQTLTKENLLSMQKKIFENREVRIYFQEKAASDFREVSISYDIDIDGISSEEKSKKFAHAG